MRKALARTSFVSLVTLPSRRAFSFLSSALILGHALRFQDLLSKQELNALKRCEGLSKVKVSCRLIEELGEQVIDRGVLTLRRILEQQYAQVDVLSEQCLSVQKLLLIALLQSLHLRLPFNWHVIRV